MLQWLFRRWGLTGFLFEYLLATFKYTMLQDRAAEGQSTCDVNLPTFNTIRVISGRKKVRLRREWV